MAVERADIRLAILVVYAVDEGLEPLLELHLRRIARHTRVPYAVFGSVLRATPRALSLLRDHPHVRLLPGSPVAGGGKAEHGANLDSLARAAAGWDATHIATLHVDSFPVSDDWATHLAGLVDARCPVVTGVVVDASCLMMAGDFVRRSPTGFLPTPHQRSSAAFARCLDDWQFVSGSGSGFVHQAHVDGLSVRFLPHVIWRGGLATIYAGRVVHIGAAVRNHAAAGLGNRPPAWRVARGALLAAAGALVRAVLPHRARRAAQRVVGARTSRFVARGAGEFQRVRARAELSRLLQDPEAYVAEVLGSGAGLDAARSPTSPVPASRPTGRC